MYDIVIAGAGLSGCILARKCAEELNKKVLIVERRNHIAGNLYDEKDENGILIQKYGPHFFTSDEWWIMEYLMQFGEWYVWQPRAMSWVDDKYLWRPYNFHTAQQLLGPKDSIELIKKLREDYKGRKRVSVYELIEHTNKDISAYGKLLYEKLFVPYCSKQWGVKPEEIDKSIVERTQISMGYDWQLGEEVDFQYLPKEGYTQIIKNMISHENIEIKLETDVLDYINFKGQKILYNNQEISLMIYTGEIDQLFQCKWGQLPYRSRYFEYKTFDNLGYELPVEVITYPQQEAYLRRTEFKRFNNHGKYIEKTVIADEYSVPYDKSAKIGNEPYYPINNAESKELYNEYYNETKRYQNLIICGRLAEFKYLDMFTVVKNDFRIFEEIKKMFS